MKKRKGLRLAATLAVAGLGAPLALRAQFAGASGGYQGPQILSRSSRGLGGADKIPYFSLFGTAGVGYWDGLTSTTLSSDGKLVDQHTRTAFVGGGVGGSRSGLRDSFAATLAGYWYHTVDVSRYGGANANFGMNYQRQLSRRWTFFNEATASTQTTALSRPRGEFGVIAFDESFATSISSVDIDVKSLGDMAGFAFQKSARTTFSMSGGAFTVRRGSLISVNSMMAQGEMSRVISRRQAIGVSYFFNTYRFLGQFGNSVTHGARFMYQRSLTPRWGLSAGVGPYRVESQRVGQIKVDPFVAAIIGQTVGYSVFHRINYGIGYNFALAGNYRKSAMAFLAQRGLGAGNDLLLTSRSDSAGATYNYASSKNSSVFASFTYYRLSPQLIGVSELTGFEVYNGTTGFAYRIKAWLHASVNATFMRGSYNSGAFLDRTRRGINFSLGASPSSLPLPGFR